MAKPTLEVYLDGELAGTLLPSDRPEGEPEPDSLEILSPDRLDEVLTQLPQRPLAADEKGEVRLSLAGAQSKLPVVEVDGGFALPHGSGRPTTHILKPEPFRFPGLVANEFFKPWASSTWRSTSRKEGPASATR